MSLYKIYKYIPRRRLRNSWMVYLGCSSSYSVCFSSLGNESPKLFLGVQLENLLCRPVMGTRAAGESCRVAPSQWSSDHQHCQFYGLGSLSVQRYFFDLPLADSWPKTQLWVLKLGREESVERKAVRYLHLQGFKGKKARQRIFDSLVLQFPFWKTGQGSANQRAF